MQINPKQEFVKAIMSVLRLEPNIYTTGAIETLIERLRVNDYQMFIAYLGERKADYEKPIENIAKGVDEFYNKKLEPHRIEAEQLENKTLNALADFKQYISNQIKNNFVNDEVINIVEENYGEQDQTVKDYQIEYRTKEAIREKVIEKIEELSEDEPKLINLLKLGTNIVTKEKIFSEKIIDAIIDIGFSKIMLSDNFYTNKVLFDYLFTKNVKPNIEQQITIKEYEKIYEPEQLSEKTKLLLKQKPRYEEIGY